MGGFILKKQLKLVVFILMSLIVMAGCSEKETSGGSGEASSDYPKKPIELIVPYPPGGGTDTVARAVEQVVNKYIPNDQQVVIVNRAGGTGTVGNTEVFNAKPDGYTMGLVTVETLSVQPHFGNTVYTHDSFQPITRVTSEPQIFVVRSDAPWDTFEEWLEFVKQNPNKFTYATPGPGSAGHIAMEAIATAEGFDVKDVPQEGGGPAKTAVLGGDVDGLILTFPELKAHIESGELKILANVGETKTEPLKDIPTLKDLGIDVGLDAYYAFVAPKGIQQDVLDTLHEAFKKALEDPDFVEQFESMDFTPAYASPEDTQKVITDYFNSTGETLKEIGLIE